MERGDSGWRGGGDSGWRGGIAGGRRGEGRRVSMSTGVRKGNVF